MLICARLWDWGFADLEVPPESDLPPCRKVLPDVEVKLVERLLAKYGTDFERMEMDVRRNIYQWTVTQIQRKVALYMEMAEDLGCV